MREREEILKEFKDIKLGLPLSSEFGRELANLNNPRLHLEVLLDIRELLIELNRKIDTK